MAATVAYNQMFSTHRISSDRGVVGDAPNAVGIVVGSEMSAALPSWNNDASAGSAGGYLVATYTRTVSGWYGLRNLRHASVTVLQTMAGLARRVVTPREWIWEARFSV